MSHLGREALRRVLAGEAGPQEVEAAAAHLVSCELCRTLAGTIAGERRAENPKLAREGPLQLVFALIDQEHQWAVDYLAAVAAGPHSDPRQVHGSEGSGRTRVQAAGRADL